MKVAVLTPSYGDPKAQFVVSLLVMQEAVLTSRIVYNGAELTPTLRIAFAIGNSRIDEARNNLAEAALNDGCDYVLWLDADQTFPPDTLFRLAAHDLPIVGCNYAIRHNPNALSSAWRDGKRIEPKDTGLEPVDVLGLGVCLVKRKVFETLPRPWFEPYRHGEDGYFCEKARQHGIIPHVDHSLKVGHIDETIRMLP